MSETNVQQPIQLAIMNRLTKFGLFKQAFDLANQSYARVKSSNKLIEATLSQAESVANQLARPVLNTLEPQIHLVDNLACQGFDKIESNVTTLAKQPQVEQLIKRVEDTIGYVQDNGKQVRSMIDQTVDVTRNRIDVVRKQASEHVHSMMNVSETVIRSVDNSLNAAESALERVLPVLNAENESNDNQSSSSQSSAELKTNMESVRHLFQRMVRFSDKLRRRIVQYTVEKWYITIYESGMNFQKNILNVLKNYLSKQSIEMQQMDKPKQS